MASRRLASFDVASNICQAVLDGADHFVLGKAVQVEPMQPMLKPPEIKRLKLEYDKLLSTFAFDVNLRRYSWAPCRARWDRANVPDLMFATS